MQTPELAPTETPACTGNPFALMMDPQAVLSAVEQSPRLAGLQRRVYRPLDRPAAERDEWPQGRSCGMEFRAPR
jgi:hypothetical protein